MVPASPAIYRNLYLYGRKALDDTGHGHDFIMAGETAPLGGGGHTDRSPIAPKEFIRELFCMDSSGHAYAGASASARGCSAFDKLGPLRATAWAHHPYTKYLPPNKPDPNHDAITMANINDLPALLDQAARVTHHVASGLAIMSTEFGYETNPPDPFVGIPLDKQAEYLNEGDFLAFSSPRLVGNTQFLLTDAAPLRQYPKSSKHYWFTYQSGLQFFGGKPKPAQAAYMLPFVVTGPSGTDASGSQLYGVWGQLRFRPHPLPPGTPADLVQIEFEASGSKTWTAVGSPIAVFPARGFFGGRPCQCRARARLGPTTRAPASESAARWRSRAEPGPSGAAEAASGHRRDFLVQALGRGADDVQQGGVGLLVVGRLGLERGHALGGHGLGVLVLGEPAGRL